MAGEARQKRAAASTAEALETNMIRLGLVVVSVFGGEGRGGVGMV